MSIVIQKYSSEIKNWDTAKFLDKAKLTLNGKITRACFILLGKDNKEHYLDSAVKIRWNLKTIDNQDKDYEIFSIPFIITVDEVFAKIRNLKYRYLPDGTLFPLEYLRYEPFVIRESIHNCIAHQDYSKKARINVVEFEDEYLVFSNYGSFLPKSVEDVVLKDTPEELYRNPFLVEAMRNLDMIETQGGGLRKIFNFQKNRYFPMPEFDFSDGKVKFIVTGKIINPNYARILHKNPDLKFDDVLILDNAQKYKTLTNEELTFCKNNNFVTERNGKIELFVEDENESNKEFGIKDGINVGVKDGIKDGINQERDEKGGINKEKFGINSENGGIPPPNGGVNGGINIMQKIIIDFMYQNPRISVLEIVNQTNKSRRTIENNINKLKELNVITRIGSRKTGKWEIVRK